MHFSVNNGGVVGEYSKTVGERHWPSLPAMKPVVQAA
jgi:hypothetical protein